MLNISQNFFFQTLECKKSFSQSKSSEKQSTKSQKFIINLLSPPKICPDEIRSNRSQMKKRISLSIPKSKSFIFCKEQTKSVTKTACSQKQIKREDKKIKFFTQKNINPSQKNQNYFDQIKINFINIEKEISFLKEETFDSRYQLLEKIGQGAHSAVYKCRNRMSKQLYAVKITKKVDQQVKNKMVKQYKLLKTLENPNVLKLFQLFYDQKQQQIHIVSELILFKDLRSFITQKKQQKEQISESQIKFMFIKILQSVDYLHKSGLSHRDLKPQNILYNSETKQIKIIDFQISKENFFKNEPYLMWTNTGTLHYRAPQTFNIGYNQKIDVWSLGIMIYELLMGKFPFSSFSQKQTIKKIKTQKINYQNLKCSKKLKYLIQRMLEKQPFKRISCQQSLYILRSSYSQSYKIKFKDDEFLHQNRRTLIRQQNFQHILQFNWEQFFTQDSLRKISPTFRSKIQFLNWQITGVTEQDHRYECSELLSMNFLN